MPDPEPEEEDVAEEDEDEPSASESDSAVGELEKGDADEYKDEAEKERDDEMEVDKGEEQPASAKSPAKRALRGRTKSPAKRARTKSPVKKAKAKDEAKAGVKEEDKEASPEPVPRAAAPKRPSIDKRRSSGSAPKSASATPAKGGKGALPAARAYVLAQFTKIAAQLFEGKLDAAGAEQWGRDVEAALFAHFKEGAKAVAGNRYKAQFTLLNSSLPKTRAAVKAAIVDGSTPPTKVALLSAEDLATEEQLAELEAQRAESLRQAVRIEPEYNAVRIGRDGFEEVEQEKNDDDIDVEERKEDEFAPKTPVEERRTRGTATPEPPMTAVESTRSPFARRRSSLSTPLSPVARRASFSQAPVSPIAHRPSVEFASAWGTSAKVTEEYDMEQDQDAVDLSDLATSEVNYDDGLDGPAADPMADFLARPVVWSGGVSPPPE